jgi:hypothetical protein
MVTLKSSYKFSALGLASLNKVLTSEFERGFNGFGAARNKIRFGYSGRRAPDQLGSKRLCRRGCE